MLKQHTHQSSICWCSLLPQWSKLRAIELLCNTCPDVAVRAWKLG